jgi:NTP pyrophosphatase (non-canonical NTP hydrolase)
MKEPNPWQPTTNVLDLKIIGKTLEENGELVQALSRCLIQGIDDSHPTTGKPNRIWLQEELADVLANIEILVTHFDLDQEAMMERVDTKRAYLKKWHNMEGL